MVTPEISSIIGHQLDGHVGMERAYVMLEHSRKSLADGTRPLGKAFLGTLQAIDLSTTSSRYSDIEVMGIPEHAMTRHKYLRRHIGDIASRAAATEEDEDMIGDAIEKVLENFKTIKTPHIAEITGQTLLPFPTLYQATNPPFSSVTKPFQSLWIPALSTI